jgi:hypothetical protein
MVFANYLLVVLSFQHISKKCDGLFLFYFGQPGIPISCPGQCQEAIDQMIDSLLADRTRII